MLLSWLSTCQTTVKWVTAQSVLVQEQKNKFFLFDDKLAEK